MSKDRIEKEESSGKNPEIDRYETAMRETNFGIQTYSHSKRLDV